MTPSYVMRLIKYGKEIHATIPPLEFKQAKIVGKVFGLKGVHSRKHGYLPGSNEFDLNEAQERYNNEIRVWEKKVGVQPNIAEANIRTKARN